MPQVECEEKNHYVCDNTEEDTSDIASKEDEETYKNEVIEDGNMAHNSSQKHSAVQATNQRKRSYSSLSETESFYQYHKSDIQELTSKSCTEIITGVITKFICDQERKKQVSFESETPFVEGKETRIFITLS